jgi:hypothetical protein
MSNKNKIEETSTPISSNTKNGRSNDNAGTSKNVSKSTGWSLSPKERGWTTELENAIHQSVRSNDEAIRDLGVLTDFEIAAHAIVAKDNAQLALHRIRRLKQFKQQHGIPDKTTVFHAIQIVHKFVHAYPNFIQAFGKDSYGRNTITFRLIGLTSPPPFNHSEEDRFMALYYIFHALQPDLDSIRTGTVFVGDLEGITRQYFTYDLFTGGRALTKDSYPIKVKDFPCLSTPSMFSAVYAMCYPFFSTTLKQKYVSCTPTQIQEHFPKSLWSKRLGGTMTERDLLDTIEENLKRRFENEERFRL